MDHGALKMDLRHVFRSVGLQGGQEGTGRARGVARYALGKDLVKWVDVIIDSCLKVGGPEDRRAVESKLRALLRLSSLVKHVINPALWAALAERLSQLPFSCALVRV